MRAYLTAILGAMIIAFVTGTGWYSIFGYDTSVSAPENIVAIYSSASFWKGFLIWSLLYLVFITLPIAYFKKKAS
jgi:hypothetical protein